MNIREELLVQMRGFCEKERKRRGWWIFNRPDIWFSEARMLQPWEKSVNKTRPDKICFPRVKEQICVDKSGIEISDKLIEWKEIEVVGFMIERTNPTEDTFLDVYTILVGLKDGGLVSYLLGDISSYHGLAGHFIEEFRQDYLKSVTKRE